MRKLLLEVVALITLGACADYEDKIDVIPVSVRLQFPDSYTAELSGVRVELQDATASTFVDSTDIQGIAHFAVPAGIYKASSSSQKVTRDYRYFFNGTRSQIIITSDFTNVVPLKITMSKKRIIH